ncbi:MAG: aldose 1-epimerase [Deltaproteobacteria bacterium]|nr:aldose 1-epimerase [Deltaproteobacteria bacterium]
MYALSDSRTAAFPTVTLSDAAADLHATVAPTVGMIVCSLRHRGDELLGQRKGLEQYARSGSTMGIPLLHPWANRLGGLAYRAAGQTVRLDASSPLLHKDGAGLPMHGLLAGYDRWRVVERGADAHGARLTAALDFGADAALLAGFPFPHTLTLAVTLRDATLSIATTLRPSGAAGVPVSFGFHPYLQLPGVPRAEWQVSAPVRERALLDARQIPTGAREPVVLEPGPLGTRGFDDLFTRLDRPARFGLAGGGRQLTVDFDDGFPCAQIYAPPAEALICFEPMTAPTNALASGDDLRVVAPGDAFRAVFSVAVTART